MRFPVILVLCTLIPSLVRAQLCTGSLGDPVAGINFGEGSSIVGPPLSSEQTNYQFLGTCPNDGFYSITNLTQDCFGQSWHTLNQDHTPGDNNGYFMLVNASNAPGIFYKDTVRNLCANTTYEFSAFVVSVLKRTACSGNGIQPDLTFIIETTDGTELKRFNTGRIPSTDVPEWKQYGTFITTTAQATSVVIKLINNAPGGCGNDLALDDIQFRPCGPQLNLTVNGISTSSTSFCEDNPQNQVIKASYSGGFNAPKFQWQVADAYGPWTDITGATADSLVRTPTVRGTYRYRMLIAEGDNIYTTCRIASDPVTFTVSPPLSVTIAPTPPACTGSTVILYGMGAEQFQWSGPAGFTGSGPSVQIPQFSSQQAGIYQVLGTSPGCEGQASTTLVALPGPVATTVPAVRTCENVPVQLTASGGGSYQWTPSAGLDNATLANPRVLNPTAAETFIVTVTAANGCTDTASVLLSVSTKPVANAGPDLSMLKDRPVTLKSSVGGINVSFRWTPVTDMVNPGSATPTVNPPVSTSYRLEVTSDDGCGVSTDEVQVLVFDQLSIPNTFTPNGDGYNDTWVIKMLTSFERSVTEIYNTAGQRIYRDIGHSKPWDGTYNGKAVPAGTYYYVIDLGNQRDRFSGYVTIIR